MENEISKIKIWLPFSEILRNFEYRAQIPKMVKEKESVDTVNLQDDPTIMFGPRVENADDEEDVPLFYFSLRIHDMYLHNTMLDSGASHN